MKMCRVPIDITIVTHTVCFVFSSVVDRDPIASGFFLLDLNLFDRLGDPDPILSLFDKIIAAHFRQKSIRLLVQIDTGLSIK